MVQAVFVWWNPASGRVKSRMQEYPGRLSHSVPRWVKCGAVFHIRIRIEPNSPLPLSNLRLAPALLDSALRYHEAGRWFCPLFLLMPDHLHALLAFPPDKKMSDVIGIWKGFQAKQHGIRWQNNYFDHRIRNDPELTEKAAYIRNNPVAKGLCTHEDEWPWVYCGDLSLSASGGRAPPTNAPPTTPPGHFSFIS